MPKISVRTAAQAKETGLPAGYAGQGTASAYFADDGAPLHLHSIELAASETVHVAGGAVDYLVYVWRGAVTAGGRGLPSGSSVIVEHGASVDITAGDDIATILAFNASEPAATALAGGHVHILPAGCAPRNDSLGGSPGLGGVMHADADCPTCAVWLHENRFPGSSATRQDAEAGIHSHSEDEIIFVLGGEIRLGTKLYGPGTALAIAGDTLYSFTAGPAGLHFANFRAGKPSDIRFAKGHSISETAYWRERLPRPEYLSPA